MWPQGSLWPPSLKRCTYASIEHPNMESQNLILYFFAKVSTSYPMKSTDRSIDQNGKRDSCQESRSLLFSQSTNQLITEIHCEKSSLQEGSVISTLSSEIKWILAIRVCLDKPEFNA